MIPRIIHQIWFQGQHKIDNPYHLACQSSWKEHHRGWTYWLWDADSIAKLLKSEYPEFHDLYESYPLMIEKIDVAKYFILQRYGGFYMDMDIECRRCLEPLRNFELMVAQIYMTPMDILLFTFNQVKRGPFINNAAIASIPGHPFWRYATRHLRRHSRKRWYYTREYYVSASTGPQFFTRMVQSYPFPHRDRLLIAPPWYFEPNSLEGNEAVAAARSSYGIHRQDNSWLTWFYRSLKQLRYGRHGAQHSKSAAPYFHPRAGARRRKEPAPEMRLGL